jgi:hypothetical protein
LVRRAATLLVGAIGSLLDDRGRHRASIIDLDRDVVGVEIVAGADDGVAPLGGGSGC